MDITQIDNLDNIKPGRSTLTINPELYVKKYTDFIKCYNKIDSSNDYNANIAYIKDCLLKYCNFILTLNGQSSVTDTKRAVITNIAECAYLDTKMDTNLGCKVSNQLKKKKYISDLLIQMLVSLFKKSQEVDNNLIENSDMFIDELFKSFETYCHFMAMMHSGPIYADYIKQLVDNLNVIFTEPIIFDRCQPNNRGYGCARMITKINRLTPVMINKSKILVVSMNNLGFDTSTLQEGTDLVVHGGKISRKYINNKRLSKKNNRNVLRIY